MSLQSATARLLFLCGIVYAFANARHVNIAVLAPRDDRRMFSENRISPAIEYSIEKIQNDTYFLQDTELRVSYRDSKCSISDSMNEAIDFYVHKKVDIFLGPTCDYAAAPVARQIHYWNIPMITPGCVARYFSVMKKDMFPLMTRVGSSITTVLNFIISILKHYQWKKFKIIYDPNGQAEKSERFCHIAAEGLHNGMRFQKEVPNLVQEYFKFDTIEDILLNMDKELGTEFAVVVLCASSDSVRDIMLKAREMKFDNGEYVFFNIDLFSSKDESEMPWYRENDPPEKNEEARKAYEALMTVTLRKPTSPEYRKFSEEVKRRAKLKNNNFTYGEEEVNSFVGAFHDAVILYALALNETLTANSSISNGTEITKRMWNRTFEGITGVVSIDDNGDRNADYSLLDLNPITKRFEVVANYYGNKKKYEPVQNREIHWAGGRKTPPPDTPVCGFDNSKCPPEKPFPAYGIVIIVLGSLLIVVMIVAFILYRKLECRRGELRNSSLK